MRGGCGAFRIPRAYVFGDLWGACPTTFYFLKYFRTFAAIWRSVILSAVSTWIFLT